MIAGRDAPAHPVRQSATSSNKRRPSLAGAMVESTNATLFSDRPSVDSTTVDAFAVSARLDARPASPDLAWVLALDDDLKEIVGFTITAGVEFRL